MTSSFVKTLTIGSCAVALLAFTDAAQAQQCGYPGVHKIGGWLPLPWRGTATGRLRYLPPCSSDGQTITLSLNTGTGGPLGTADPNWTVEPGGTAYSTSTVRPGTTTSIWLANTNTTKWIQPDPLGTPAHFDGGTYVYRTRFATSVDPHFYESITITGKYAADDAAVIKLNGVPIAPACTAGEWGTPAGAACFRRGKTVGPADQSIFTRSATNVSFTNVFINEVTIEVENSGGLYSGLFADLTVTAICSKCTTPPPCSGIQC